MQVDEDCPAEIWPCLFQCIHIRTRILPKLLGGHIFCFPRRERYFARYVLRRYYEGRNLFVEGSRSTHSGIALGQALPQLPQAKRHEDVHKWLPRATPTRTD